MKTIDLFENHEMLTPEQFRWCKNYIDLFSVRSDSEFFAKDKKIETTRRFLFISGYCQDEEPLPDYIRFGHINQMSFTDCQLENFDMVPSSATSVTFKQSSKIIPKTLKGLSKTLKKCERIKIPGSVEKGLLEVFKIAGMKELAFSGNDNMKMKKQSPIEIAIGIINRHLDDGKDVFECQNALIDRGLEDFC